LALVTVSFVPLDVRPTFANVLWQPTKASEIRSTYENAFGNAVLDLTHVDFNRKPRRVLIKVRFGNVDVVVPADVPVVVRSQVKFGHMEAFGREFSGGDVRGEVRSNGDRDLGRLTIVADVAFGNTDMCRREAPGAQEGCRGAESRSDGRPGRFDFDFGGDER
jgi:hypothetical protein